MSDTKTHPPLNPALSSKQGDITVLIAFILVCLNLRIVFGGVGPLIHYMHLTPLVASALTAFPPLCMGLFAPFAPAASRRLGEERAIFLAMLILTIGILVRSYSISGLLIGTVIASAGVAALNVLTPVFIRQNFSAKRIGVMMGVYAMMMGGGGGIMAALAVPIYGALGNSWPLALGVAAVPAAVALISLLPLLGATSKPANVVRKTPWHIMLRHRITWSIIAYFGIQCMVFYSILVWLPLIYIDKGLAPTTAGLYLALNIFAVAAGGFCGPTLAARKNDHRLHILVSIVLCCIGIVGIMLAPVTSGPIWVVILGLGMGAGQGIPGVLYAKRTVDHGQMTQLSGMVQTIGYLIAATGPVIAATLHHLSGGWTMPLEFLLAVLILNVFFSLHGGRDHVIVHNET